MIDNELEALRSRRPVPDSDWAASPAGRQVLAQAMRTAPHRRGRRFVTVSAIAGTAFVATAAFAVIQLWPTHNPTAPGCYQSFSVTADMTEATGAAPGAGGAAEACQKLWRTLPVTDRPTDTENPVECVNNHGGLGVFPAPSGLTAEQACSRLGGLRTRAAADHS